MMKFSTASFIFFSVVLHFLSLSAVVRAQKATDSCSSSLNLNDLSFDASLLQCVEVWSPQNYILRYAKTQANTWSFVLSAPDSNSWIGIGFSKDGQMIGSSAIVGWISSGGDGRGAKQYYLKNKSPNQVMPDQGDLKIVNRSLKIDSVSSRLYMSFQFTADQPPPSLLYAVGSTGIFPAAPDYRLTQHRFKVSTSMNYNTGAQKGVKEPHSELKKAHGLLNMFSWGIMTIIGALIARHLKNWDPMWFYAHTAVQSIGFLLGLSGIICGLVLEKRLKVSVSTHKGLGIFIFVMGCLQITALLLRPDKQSKYRKYWNWYHQTIGRLIMIFAIANVFYGIHLGKAGSAWNGGYGFAVAVLFIFAVGLEVRKFTKN